jgi:imidazoleglycerol phosphate synthase glutamine amidotransferase subunit HisH
MSDSKVLVIDYRTGNSQSVAYALEAMGVDYQVDPLLAAHGPEHRRPGT